MPPLVPPLASRPTGRLGPLLASPAFDRTAAAASLGRLIVTGSGAVGPATAVRGTLGLLAVDALLGVVLLAWRKRAPATLALTTLALFGAAHAQVYAAWGAHHYACDRPPGPLDWVQFTAAHALRAADVLDFIEEYGPDLQHVRHASPLSGGLLVAMHLTVDVYLVAFLLRWVKKIRGPGRRPRPGRTGIDSPAEASAGIGCLGVVLVLFGFGAAARTLDWDLGTWQIFLWPLDNFLRLVDVGDAMAVFDWRLHAVPQNRWSDAVAVLFRLSAALLLAPFAALIRLGVLRGRMQTVEGLLDGLSDADPLTRSLAVEALGDQSAHARAVAPALLKLLAADEPEVKQSAVRALGRIGGPDAVPALLQLLGDQASNAAHWAAEALGRIGPDAAPAVPALARLAAEASGSEREAAVLALGRIGLAASPAVPTLGRILADRNTDLSDRERAAEALGRIGPAAATATPVLVQVVAAILREFRREEGLRKGPASSRPTQEVARLRRPAAVAVSRIGRASVPAMDQARKADDEFVRGAGDELLNRLNLVNRIPVPDLADALANANSESHRLHVVLELEQVGPPAAPAAPALAGALASKDDNVLWSVAEALGRIGPAVSGAASALRRLVAKNPEGWLRAKFREALDRIEAPPPANAPQ